VAGFKRIGTSLPPPTTLFALGMVAVSISG
jgi:hypothetical protein